MGYRAIALRTAIHHGLWNGLLRQGAMQARRCLPTLEAELSLFTKRQRVVNKVAPDAGRVAGKPFAVMHDIKVDEAALSEAIAGDTILQQVAADRAAWRAKQDNRTDQYSTRIDAIKIELKPLRKALTKAIRAIRSKECEMSTLRRTRSRSYKYLKSLDRKETARLRFLKARAVEKAVAETRRRLAKEFKIVSMI